MKRAIGMITKHLNSRPATIMYPCLIYPGETLPLEVVILARGKSKLGQTRKQHDFFVLIRMSNQSRWSSHIWNNRFSSTTDWV